MFQTALAVLLASSAKKMAETMVVPRPHCAENGPRATDRRDFRKGRSPSHLGAATRRGCGAGRHGARIARAVLQEALGAEHLKTHGERVSVNRPP